MERTFLENLSLPDGAIEAILAENEKENQSHAQQLAELSFQHRLEQAVTARKGRSMEAIRALLDVENLKAQEPDALTLALDSLKKDKSYLFDEDTPPSFAPGAGMGTYRRPYTQEELGKMSMAEYKAYRRG